MAKLLLSTAIALTATAAFADYPERPVRLIVGFSAGGGTDTSARGFGSFAAEAPTMNGMPMVIVNQPGRSRWLHALHHQQRHHGRDLTFNR